MYVSDEIVVFESCDIHFVKKFGVEDATEMVQNFYSLNSHPFIYDTYQLSTLLEIDRKLLFKMAKKHNLYYHDISIKKSDGTSRQINAPTTRLKYIQKRILGEILSHFPVSKYATAYKKGVAITENANPHRKKKYLLKMDLEDFFGSITFIQVYRNVFNTRYFPKQIGTMLTEICTKDDVLPQGAPTSPMLSNLVMRHFDDTIGDWCMQRGISYTRYSDDMTFSGDVPLYFVYEKVSRMLDNMGFSINEKKTHFITNASRQTVTGLTVNDDVRIPVDYKRKLRQEVYYALKYTVEGSLKYTKNEKYITTHETYFGSYEVYECQKYLNHLLGQINYVLGVEPQNKYFRDAKQKLIDKYKHKYLLLY